MILGIAVFEGELQRSVCGFECGNDAPVPAPCLHMPIEMDDEHDHW